MNISGFIRRLFIILLAPFSFFLITNTVMGEGHIQSLIDEASSGGVIHLLDHTYEEEIVITKPITLIGSEHTKLRFCSNNPMITIQANQVRLENIHVEYCLNDKNIGTSTGASDTEAHEHDHQRTESAINTKQSAISLTGDRIEIDNIHVTSSTAGIQLDGVTNSVINGGTITTNGSGNGIDVWQSTENIIQNVEIQDVHDGIYLEQGSKNMILNNRIQSARYGIHLMYSDHVIIQSNNSNQNFTGAMIMTSNGVKVLDNSFSDNNLNVNSQGLLLFDAHRTTVTKNRLTENRVGIFMESATENTIMNNRLTNNFIGVQFNNTNENVITTNSFIGNVNELQAVNSTENDVNQNYWDASIKLEKYKEGVSLFPYRADPLYLLLTEDVPAYQLFFDSPGITVLKTLLEVPSESVMQDHQTLMDPPQESNGAVFHLLSFILKLVLGICFMVIGLQLFKIRRT